MDSLGNSIWSKTYSDGNNSIAWKVHETIDGGNILVGETSIIADWEDIYLIKTDLNGDTAWCKKYGGLIGDYAYSILTTFDRGYIITGFTDNFSVGGFDGYFIKTDNNGISDCNEFQTQPIVSAHAVLENSTNSQLLSGTSLLNNQFFVQNSTL